jgi:hypothetical protein
MAEKMHAAACRQQRAWVSELSALKDMFPSVEQDSVNSANQEKSERYRRGRIFRQA